MTRVGPSPRTGSFRYNSESQPPAPLSTRDEAGGSGGFPERRVDAFQVVQASSGLEEDDQHPVGAALYLEQARQLLGKLAKTPVTQRSLAPRRLLYWLLREVLEGGERVEYADLKWRTERFEFLVLVRPDGYLVAALDGTPLQRLGPPTLVEGEWWVENQSKLAQQLGLPLTWHVADARIAQFLRKEFESRGWKNISVRHTKPGG
ncbi:hypothetical protein [Archangium violaceum]|nr:hypothetical protein [Archangium violaceum]